MSFHLILCDGREHAEQVSAELFALSIPLDERRPDEITLYAAVRVRHPVSDDWACVLPDDFDLPVHPVLRENPSRMEPGAVADVVRDIEQAIGRVIQRERLDAAFVRNEVRSNRLLTEEEARAAGWFAEPERD